MPKQQIKPISNSLPNHVISMIQIRNIFRRNWKRFRDVSDHSAMTRLNKIIKKDTIKNHNMSWNSKLSKLDKSSSPFWKISKIFRKKSSSIPILKDKVYYTQLEKAELLAHTFKMNHSSSAHLSDNETVTEVNNIAALLDNISISPQNSYLIS